MEYSPGVTGSHILVVDDVPTNLSVLTCILRKLEFRVRPALTGALALRSALVSPPDLILLDVSMPGMDGFQVCEELKASSRTAHIPVIFISALTEIGDKMKAFLAGGVDYITKPFHVAEVSARVQTHLMLNRLQRELHSSNTRLQERVHEQVKEISLAQMAIIFAMSKLAESRDDDTGKHLERVQLYVKTLALRLRSDSPYRYRINDSFIENVYHSSPLHDIGKVAVPDRILLKPGSLTDEEKAVMKVHVLEGAKTLEAVRRQYPNNDFVTVGIDIAKYHHEKWDGTGYPFGLAGDDIPLCARILALADVYDALRTRRCYKEAFSHGKARQIILDERERHFDPVVVDAFLAVEPRFRAVSETLGD